MEHKTDWNNWFENHQITLKEASMDETNQELMCESEIPVVDFDRIATEYSDMLHLKGVINTNDALLFKDGKYIFIEFKNGNMKEENLFYKIYDSVIFMIDEGIVQSFKEAREKISYILVYNSDKVNPKLHDSDSREKLNALLFKKAKQEKVLIAVEKFRGYLFNEVHTYSKQEFQDKFVDNIERNFATSNG